jgi:hypothetical protein
MNVPETEVERMKHFILLVTCLPVLGLATVAHAAGKWDVTFESANLDTVWVAATIVSDKLNYVPCSLNLDCHTYGWTLTIVPPALGVKQAWSGLWLTAEIRNGGTYFHVPDAPIDDVLKVALLPNQAYTFDGQFVHTTGNHSCDVPQCSHVEEFDVNEWDTGLLPTRQATWGAVKSMYRSP